MWLTGRCQQVQVEAMRPLQGQGRQRHRSHSRGSMSIGGVLGKQVYLGNGLLSGLAGGQECMGSEG